MVRPALRSRSYRRVKVKTPGGALKTRYLRRKPKAARCSCGKPLGGVLRDRPTRMSKASKASKRPQRAFGGNLCPRCLKNRIKETKVYKEGV